MKLISGINDECYLNEGDEKWASLKLSEFDISFVLETIKMLQVQSKRIPDLTNFAETYYADFLSQIGDMKASNSVKHLKHLRQQAALLEQLSARHLLSDNFCYVELGAGKGGLSEKIGERFQKSNFILIDRATVRQKKENQFTNAGRGGFERVKGDIANFDLEMVEDEKPKVCIAKHLCGEATDLAIRGSLRAKELQGIVIAR